MIRQVATAAEQQTATTTDIAQNIQQVAEVTQQSANGAQQSVTAAIELAQLSNQLQQLVGGSGQAGSGELVNPMVELAADHPRQIGVR